MSKQLDWFLSECNEIKTECFEYGHRRGHIQYRIKREEMDDAVRIEIYPRDKDYFGMTDLQEFVRIVESHQDYCHQCMYVSNTETYIEGKDECTYKIMTPMLTIRLVMKEEEETKQ